MKLHASAVCGLFAAAAITGASHAEPAFLRSKDDLGDPRGYCIDVPGFGASLALDGPIATHSCKYSRPGFFADELVEHVDGRLRLTTYDRCLTAEELAPGALVTPLACDTAGVDAWAISDEGRVSPAGDGSLCLTLAEDRVFVNTDPMTTPPYSSRQVTLETCDDAVDARQLWRFAATDEQPIENANTLRRRTPPEIAQQVRALGRVVAPRDLGAIYADLPHHFGPEDVTVTDLISYGPDERHVLEVLTGVNRNEPSGRAPVIMLVHGGGFVGGSHESFRSAATHFAGLGFVVVNITYPLAPDHPWPAGAQAVGLAVDWAAEHVVEHGGDPDRVFVLGSSAGATHVAAYAFTPSLVADGTPEVAGVILASPGLGIDPNSTGLMTAYYGEDLSDVEPMLVTRNVERANIPVLITNAEYDPHTFYESTAQLMEVLVSEHGVRPRYRQIPDTGHGSLYYTIGTDLRLMEEEILDFITTAGE